MSGQQKVRVLHVLPSLVLGGAQQSVLELIAEQRAQGRVEPSLCVLSSGGQFYDPDSLPCAADMLSFGGRLGNVVDTIRCARALRKMIRTHQPMILHTHLWLADTIGAIALRNMAVKHVCHFRDRRTWLASSDIRARLRRLVYNRLLSASEAVGIAVSAAAKTHVCTHLGWAEDRIAVVLNGVNISALEGACAPQRMHSDRTVIGAVGRLVPEKGLSFLVEAIEQLRKEGVICHVRLAGEGSLQSSLMELANELGVAEHVEMCGPVHDMHSFYQSLDILAMPSVGDEGLPRGIMEAMACGVPIVATEAATASEAMEDAVHGFLVPPADAAALAGALGRLARDPDLITQMGARCALHARDVLSVQRVAREVQSVYDELQQRG